MNICSEVCIRKKNACPSIQNRNRRKCTNHKSIFSEHYQPLATQKSIGIVKSPTAKSFSTKRDSFKEYFFVWLVFV